MARSNKPITVWISLLVPREGADTYNDCGVRVQVSLTKEDCFRDLADWLEVEYESVEATQDALGEAMDEESAREGYGVRHWHVEEQTVCKEKH